MLGFKHGARANRKDEEPEKKGKGRRPAPPDPSILGSGAAAGAGRRLRDRRAQIEAATNFADGGEVRKPEAPDPSILGSGAAADAGRKIRDRKAQIDAAAGFANGGMVRGPGTGTSDSIHTEVPEGSYIMPADSTKKIGEKNLQGMGFDVPVNLSNGEYELPPEQVHAVGVQALEQMKDSTHKPTGKKAAGDKLYLADGGEVERRKKDGSRRPAPRSDFHTNSRGQTARGFMPSSSTSVVPSAPRNVATAQAPTAQAPASDASTGRSSAPNERNWKARAETMARAKDDTAAWQEERAAQERSQAEAERRHANASRQPESENPKAASKPKAEAPKTRMGRLKAAGGRLMKGAGVVGGGLALQDMAESGVDAGNATQLGASMLTSDAVMNSAKRAVPAAGRVGAALSPAAAVGASGYAGYKYGDHINDKVEGGESLNPVEAGLGFIGTRLGEAYARYAPEWAGGISAETAQHAPEFTSMSRLRQGDPQRQASAQQLEAQPSRPRQPSDQAQHGPGGPVSPSPASQPQPQPQQTASQPQPQQTASQQQEQPLQNNVTRDGNRFSGGRIGQGFTINGEQPRGISVLGSSGATGSQSVADLSRQPPEVRQAGGFQSDPLVIGGDRIADQAEEKALRAASRSYHGSPNGQLTASQISAMRGIASDRRGDNTARANNQADNATRMATTQMQQQEQNRRTGAALNLDQQRFDSEQELRGFEVRRAQQAESLRQQYQEAGTEDERGAIAEQLRILEGGGSQNSANNYEAKLVEVPIDPAKPELGTRQELYSFDKQTGQWSGGGEKKKAGPTPSENHIRALKNNPSLAAQFDEEYFPGAAEQYLGAN